MTGKTSIALNLLGLNCGTQIRVRQDDDTVKKYFETMDAAGHNEMFPPILVYRDTDGSHWIADGHHRVSVRIASVVRTSLLTNHFMKSNTKKLLTPLRAIRQHCLECVGQCREDVRTCTGTDCFLWPYRFGTNPSRRGKPL
ncbi:MAG: hypothetical protein ACRC2T_20645, partial [Thermoguttaceae bacterium]